MTLEKSRAHKRRYPATSPRNRRPKSSLTCPTCGTPNALTPKEARSGYQCRNCANLEEGPV